MASIFQQGSVLRMHMNITRNAARAAAAGAMLTLCMGSAQAVMAKPAPAVVNVPCSATALASEIANAVSGETLSLVKFCTYRLTAPLVPIGMDLTIKGDADTIERSYRGSTPDFSVFTVTSGARFVLSNVNIRNGDSSGIGTESPVDNSGYGGAIYNEDGNLTVIGGTFSGNTANVNGGAIYNLGKLTVRGTVFRGNQAEFGGAIASDFQAVVPSVSFIDALPASPTTITGSSFFGNTAAEGGGIYIKDSTAVLHCNFTSNTADEDGGGIYVDNGAPAEVGTDIRQNQAAQVDGGSPVVTGTGFYRNRAQDGGGIYNADVVTVTGSGFRLNKADVGAGFYNDNVATVNGGTFAYNAAGTDGGGFYNEDQATVNGSIFTRNTAGSDGAGFYNDDRATITRSQIVRNTAARDGGGIFNNDDSDTTLTSTLVSENHPDNCGPVGSVTGCTG
jgi:predicted outer membrane repeat protein